MANIYRSAMGKTIDIDVLRLANEQTIAVGNMKVNARGDELGPGGNVLRTRAQVMQEYHKMNVQPHTDEREVTAASSKPKKNAIHKLIEEDDWVDPDQTPGAPSKVRPRGSFASEIDNEVSPGLSLPPGEVNPELFKTTYGLQSESINESQADNVVVQGSSVSQSSADNAEVDQELLTPTGILGGNDSSGPKRI